MTTLDFISYCGGSLGLFLGFSALSAVEIFYYFTLRLLCMKSQQKKISTSDQNEDGLRKKNFLVETVEKSSIHGFSQIAFRKRHPAERFEQS
jgi:hypothetical protein